MKHPTTAPGPDPLPAQRASLLRRLLRRPRLEPILAEREVWRRRLEVVGFTRDRAESLEAHRWACWMALGMGRDRMPETYSAWMCPWFERLWKETR